MAPPTSNQPVRKRNHCPTPIAANIATISGGPASFEPPAARNAKPKTTRVVALTKAGEKLISPVYHRHVALLEHIFEPLSGNQRAVLEDMLKMLGRHAETMGEILE